MSAPINITEIVPLKYKALVGLIGSALSFAVPYIVEVQSLLPSPWPVVIGVALFLLSGLGVLQTPYKPAGTVLVPEITGDGTGTALPPFNPSEQRRGEFKNPWL